jgi:hypothetical protein
MEELLKFLANRLSAHSSCTVFEGDLARVWPNKGKETALRMAAIRAFAEKNGLQATIVDPGLHVTFRKISGNA